MKRFLILALALVLVLSMFGCGFLRKKAEEVLEPALTDVFGEKEEPTAEPEPEPTAEPEPEPTAEPEPEPTAEPEPEPEPVSEEFGPKNLIGMWTLTTAHVEGMTLKAADLGVEAYFHFLEDGKNVRCWSRSSDMTDEYTMAYEVSGYEITLHDRVSDEYATYDPETDMIKLESDGVEMYLERTPDAKIPDGDEPVAAATEAPAVQSTDELTGTWVMTKGISGGMTIPADSLGLDIAFRFDADGKAAMIYNGETTEGLSWVRNGDIVKLSVYGTELYDFTFDGNTLTVEESGVTMVFEKK